AIGLGAAVRYLESLDLEAVAAHEKRMTNLMVAKLSVIKKVWIWGPPLGQPRIGVVSFTVEGIHPHDMATILDRQAVAVRGGHHCAMPLMNDLGVNGTIRASVGPYTTESDI